MQWKLRRIRNRDRKYFNLRKTKETVIVCFGKVIRRDKIKAHKTTSIIEKEEKH